MGNKKNLITAIVVSSILITNKAFSANTVNKNSNVKENKTKTVQIKTKTIDLNSLMISLLENASNIHNGNENNGLSHTIRLNEDNNFSKKDNQPKTLRTQMNGKVQSNKGNIISKEISHKELTNENKETIRWIDKINNREDPGIKRAEAGTINITKRSADNIDTYSNNSMTNGINTTIETCVGAEEYCNMSREEYVEMLNNYIYPHTFEWVLIAIHTLVFVGGLVGNALVCVAVYRNHSMRTVTNYFIVNLAVADFMVILFCLPPTVLWDVTETWFFGAAMCKIILYFQSVSVTVSVLTLTFISVDRWYAICFPLKFKSTTGRAKIAILVIWAVSLTLNAPELVVLTSEQTVPLRFELQHLVQCVASWSQQTDLVWHIIKVVFIYTIPLMLITLAHYHIVKVLWRSEKIPGQADTARLAPAERCQLRSRRKAAKMLAAVVIMFAVCYFPVHFLSMIRYSQDLAQTDVITFLALISHVLCYANSAINPLIYNFMSGKFRREFRRAFCCSVHSAPENSSTLTRLTTLKKPTELVALDRNKSKRGYICKTTLF